MTSTIYEMVINAMEKNEPGKKRGGVENCSLNVMVREGLAERWYAWEKVLGSGNWRP